LRIPAHFLASLTATAILGADAKWFLIVKVASAKGTLEAKAKLAGNATLVLSGQVAVSCRGGKPTLESDMDFPGCLELQFDLDAGFNIEAIGFNVFSRKWNLVSAKWDKCWGEDVELRHTGKDPKIDLRDRTISLTDLLEWLLSDKAEKTEPSSQQRQVKESPLTLATAKTIPQLASQLDQTGFWYWHRHRASGSQQHGRYRHDDALRPSSTWLRSHWWRPEEHLRLRELPTLSVWRLGLSATQVY
jgi:hypothetical protein